MYHHTVAMTPMAHQENTARFWAENQRIYDHSDPGTGKTISALLGWSMISELGWQSPGRLLVLAPLSTLGPAWVADIKTLFSGTVTVAIAHGSPTLRKRAFESSADIVLINHDGVKWLAQQSNLGYLSEFIAIVGDEFTAYKNRTAQRSKAAEKVIKRIPFVNLMSGTPIPNSITDIWFPTKMLDGGKTLGSSFFQFRDQFCWPEQVGPLPEHKKWNDRPEASGLVGVMIKPMTVRNLQRECVDLPENMLNTYYVDLPPKAMRAYLEFERNAVLQIGESKLDAKHRGVVMRKLQQLATGASYNSAGEVVKLHGSRYDFVADLVAERDHSIVAFQFRHEREALMELFQKRGFAVDYIDGTVATGQRDRRIAAFQNGDLKALLIQPASNAHGVTLTKGTATIWTSATFNGEHWEQTNRRIFRKGQTKQTETIRIIARGTYEQLAYDKLDGKLAPQADLLELLAA